MTRNDDATRAAHKDDRIAGSALLATAALSIVAMAHHPTSAQARSLTGIVHGALLLLVVSMAFGFAHVARRRGIGRPSILAGLIAYGISVVANIGAGLINGFIVPTLAARGDIGRDVFLFAWEANQALATLGVVATGVAFVFWSFDFLGRRTVPANVIGVCGLLAGIVPMSLLLGGWIDMNVAGAFAIYGAHAAWAGLVGLYTLRGRLDAG